MLNPFEYSDSFKAPLNDSQQSAALQLVVNSTAVPAGEIWEVTNIAGEVLNQSDLYIFIKEGGSPVHRVYTAKNAFIINWQGSVLLEEGQNISFITLVNTTLGLSIGGKIRYA